MKYPSDYFSHDAEYQRRRALGYAGWEKADALEAYLDLLERIFTAAHFPKQGKLLELGCGAGDFALWAAGRGYAVYGVDISPTAIQWANEKAEQRGISAHFQVASVLDLSRYEADTFDIILDGHCFHCIIGEDRVDFLREALRVLKPGGVFHINSMCGEPSCEEYKVQLDAESRSLIRHGKAVRYLGSPDEIEQGVIKAGFEVISRGILARRNDKELDLLLLDVTKR